MKKKLGSILLVMLLVFSMMQISVFPIYAATVSDDWLYRLDKSKSGISASFDTSTGVLTISGTGEMPYWDGIDGSPPPWEDYREDITSVIINNGVKNISSCAFVECINMKTISIPSSVTSIGQGAFAWCSKLTSITLPSSITEIVSWAFNGCDSLENIYFQGKAPSVYAADSGWEDADGYWISTASFNKDLVTLHYLSGESGWTSPRWEGYKTAISSGNLDIPSITEPQSDNALISLLSKHSSTEYSPELAKLAMDFSNDAYNKEKIIKSYEAHGLTGSNPKNYGEKFNFKRPAFHIGMTKEDDGGNVVVAITIRGSKSLADWIDDLNVGFTSLTLGEHYGFSLSRGHIYDELESFMRDSTFGSIRTGTASKNNKVKYLIAGHSYGGAVANLIAKTLVDSGIDKSNVFAYTFACPNVTINASNPKGKYDHIMNVYNTQDTVPKLPSSLRNKWSKYGTFYWFIDTPLSTSYNTPHDNNLYNEFMNKLNQPDQNGYLGYVPRKEPPGLIYWGGVLCPTDVKVFDKDKNLIVEVIDNRVSYKTEVDNFIIYTIDDEKYFLCDSIEQYDIEIIATDSGKMDYNISAYNPNLDEYTITKSFKDVPIVKDQKMLSSIGDNANVAETQLQIVDKQGKVTKNIEGISTVSNISTASNWAKDGIQSAAEKGFVPTEIFGNYQEVISRVEFCRMAVKWVEYATGKNIDYILEEKGVSRNPNAFTDTRDPDILAAFALGITSGTGNNSFSPEGQFTREQAATMVMNACKIIGANINNPMASGFDDINIASDWALNGINFVYSNGIMQGTGNNNFSPKLTYTREQSILTFDNIK